MEKRNQIDEIKDGMSTAFIDSTWKSDLAYRPEFVSNDYKQGKKVISVLDKELMHCDQFLISVAFITSGGIAPLLQTLRDLENRNIPGKILTTDYLCFSQPKALDKLASFSNIEVKMYCCGDDSNLGFHTKGYMFEQGEIYHILIGSSNMTLHALTENYEWNTKIIGTKNGEVIQDVLNEFETLWRDPHTLSYADFIENYRVRYQSVKKQKALAVQEMPVSMTQYRLTPNRMQAAFTANLRKLLQKGASRALLISATGDRGILMTSQAKAA